MNSVKDWEKKLKAEMAPVDDDDYYVDLFESYIRFYNYIREKIIRDSTYMSEEAELQYTFLFRIIEPLLNRMKRRDPLITPENLKDGHDAIQENVIRYGLSYKFLEFWDGEWLEFSPPTKPRLKPKTEAKTNGKRNGVKKGDDSWWTTLKEGGAITSGKAGITNMAYGKGAQKPKKKKKFKPKKEKELKPKMPPKPVKPEIAHEVIPDEPDFWRD